MRNKEIEKLVAEYPEEYCHMLEFAYGEGMMSEGGVEAIDAMFQGIDLNDKKILDIGCGMGGAALRLARHHRASVSGLEINPFMVEQANQRIPPALTSSLAFQLYDDVGDLPFEDAVFDVVYSKGVLTHVKDKSELFAEVQRILKPGGQFIVNDWLSSIEGQWGPKISRMCELEGLTLYAVPESLYKALLEAAGFRVLKIEDKNTQYEQYNRDIVRKLQTNKDEFIMQFDEATWQDAIEGYDCIAEALQEKELLVRTLFAVM